MHRTEVISKCKREFHGIIVSVVIDLQAYPIYVDLNLIVNKSIILSGSNVQYLLLCCT